MLALGSEPRLGIVPGASDFALPFATLEDALVGRFVSFYSFLPDLHYIFPATRPSHVVLSL